ncbi:hypothetical protein [Bradymonas sediminis]|uniref:Uncharacterized protein n=1 Tax=Bradymonas sediminis TaxID=1548548 RepID=A0A2Z4FKK6_9DELT|nr:hypothetical protein [Bradymonas sediminis]AWV89286.1 hypothetical protein DN745_08025 [Bradymonas sediminis]TDP73459.1 hypothetical protein DFR33_10699 [Bradymonas sediminis]
MRFRPSKKYAIAGVLVALALGLSGCGDDQSVFVGQRLEQRCNSAIPACDTRAACVMQNDMYYAGQFPGGLKTLVRSETEDAKVVVRFLLTDMLFSGSELQISAYSTGCNDFDEVHKKDMDLFKLAGDDRILEYELELKGRGDHLVEVFSDMSASYLLTLTVEE